MVLNFPPDVAGETIMNDAVLMPVGFTLVFFYIMIMLGKFDCVHTRVKRVAVDVLSHLPPQPQPGQC